MGRVPGPLKSKRPQNWPGSGARALWGRAKPFKQPLSDSIYLPLYWCKHVNYHLLTNSSYFIGSLVNSMAPKLPPPPQSGRPCQLSAESGPSPRNADRHQRLKKSCHSKKKSSWTSINVIIQNLSMVTLMGLFITFADNMHNHILQNSFFSTLHRLEKLILSCVHTNVN